MAAHIVLCPECHSMQRAGTTCGICGFPIPERKASALAESRTFVGTGTQCKPMRASRVEAIIRLRQRGLI